MTGFRASQAASWLQAKAQLERVGARKHVQGHRFGHAISVLGPTAQLVFEFVDIADPVHDSFGSHFGQVFDQLGRSAAARWVEHGHPGAGGKTPLGDFHGGQVPGVELGFVAVQSAGIAAGPENGFSR